MPRKRLFSLATAATGLLLVAVVTSGTLPVQAPPKVVGDLVIIHSSELLGYLEPCGCYKPQIGGFLRRAGYLTSLKTPTVRVENGDISDVKGRQSEIKAETVMEYFNLLKYDAVNLGEQDFRLGIEFLRSLQASYKGSLLSANVVGADSKPLFKPFVTVTRKVKGKNTSVTIIGLLSPTFAGDLAAVDPTLRVTPVNETLAALKQQATSKVRRVLVLFHGDKAGATALAKAHPWVNAVVYAHASDSPADPVTVDNTALMHAGQKGKYLGELPLTLTGSELKAGTPRSVPLGPEIADDAAAKAIRTAYQARVKGEGLLLAVKKMPAPPGGGFVGSNQCAGCHRPAHRIWQTTSHANAYKTLEDVGSENDPDCVGCHVVGLQYAGGFENLERTPKLKDVGCESCHGPSSEHVATEKKLPKAGEMSCLQCHIPDHSPEFNFTTYWEKIKH